jgi:alpha-ribazole phosphatase
MEVYLIRHTTPSIEKGICYGQSEVPLKNTFYQEAEVVLNHLPTDVDVIYSSPLNRCFQLANFLSMQFSIPVRVDNRLMELNFGEWEMKRWNDLEQSKLQDWMDDYVHVRCPGGESYQELAARTALFLEELKSKDSKKVAIVTHHGIMKAIYSHMTKISLEEAMNQHWDYGGLTVFEAT